MTRSSCGLSFKRISGWRENYIFKLNSGEIVSIYDDITEKKQAEQALKESEAKFRLLIKNSNDILVLANGKGEQFFISDVVTNITGYTSEELIGPIANVIYPDDLDIILQHSNDVISNPKQTYRVQYRHKHKEKGFVWLEAVAQNFLDDPSIKAIVVNIRDITENKEFEKRIEQSEAELKELNGTKAKLFSIIAHDLRSPFNSILGFTELLIENLNNLGVEESEKYLDIINSSAKNTLILLDNLLNWAKSQTGQVIFKPEKVVLSSIIQEIFELLNSSAKNKNILLNCFQLEEIIVFADQNMIKTILRNLISNAIKFTNSNGKIDVTALQNDNFIEIAVSDNGVGMNEEIRNKLFSLETNETTIGTANEKGSGLGLILCKEFVEKHGGKIWVESELGKGSVFKFKLPLKN